MNQDFRDFFGDKVVSDTLDGRDDKLDDPCQMHGVQLFVKMCMNQSLEICMICVACLILEDASEPHLEMKKIQNKNE